MHSRFASAISTLAARRIPSRCIIQSRFRSAPATTGVSQHAASTKAGSSSSTAPEAQTGIPVLRSLLAVAMGVGSISLVAAVVEESTSSSITTYHPTGQRFDQGHFAGRFSRMLLASDPRLLLIPDSQVRHAQDMLKNHSDYKNDDRGLWEARRIVEAAVHPETGEIIPRPFRMSGYVAFNGPICVAMIASQTTTSLLFWSWVNQSQNALVNYYNRSGSDSSPEANATLLKSYTVAVGSALAVAFGLATLIQRRYDPVRAKTLLRWVAFPSAVVASSLNCYIVRSPEVEAGVPLYRDAAGKHDVLPGETSQEAAKKGVYLTTASRALLQVPAYFVPPAILATVGPIQRYLMRNPSMTIPVTTYLLLVSFGLGWPVTTAIFPQISQVDVQQVEERFQNLRDGATNRPYHVLYYNKGL